MFITGRIHSQTSLILHADVETRKEPPSTRTHAHTHTHIHTHTHTHTSTHARTHSRTHAHARTHARTHTHTHTHPLAPGTPQAGHVQTVSGARISAIPPFHRLRGFEVTNFLLSLPEQAWRISSTSSPRLQHVYGTARLLHAPGARSERWPIGPHAWLFFWLAYLMSAS